MPLKNYILVSTKGAMSMHALQASNFLGGGNGATVETTLTQLFHYLVEGLMFIEE
jgi:hypothetical protein